MKVVIPQHAKKVFDGIIFDVYQWEQEQFDGTSKIFEAIKRPSTVEIIPVFDDDTIVLAHETQPNMEKHFFSLYSGRVEEGEGELEAAKRELMEESGLESDNWELWHTYNAGGSNKIDWQVHVYVALGCKNTEGTELEAGEEITPHGCTFDEFVDIATRPDFWSSDFSAHLCRLKMDGRLTELKDKLLK